MTVRPEIIRSRTELHFASSNDTILHSLFGSYLHITIVIGQ
jgi:hypothetical protein